MYIEGDSEFIGGDNDESMQKINEDDELNNSVDNPRRTLKKHKSAEDSDSDDDDNRGNLLKLSKNKS